MKNDKRKILIKILVTGLVLHLEPVSESLSDTDKVRRRVM